MVHLYQMERNVKMKKFIISMLAILTLIFLPSMDSFAKTKTIQSGSSYLPSTKYNYDIYLKYSYAPNEKATVSCKKSEYATRLCTSGNSKDAGVAYYFGNEFLSFGEAYNMDSSIIPAIKFPMEQGKKYTIKNMMTYYKVEAIDSTKKVGSKTYKHVIRIKYDKYYRVYIAKNHGIILINTIDTKKPTTRYKVLNYKKK